MKRLRKLTWGDIYYRCLAKGYDHGYAAYVADKWEAARCADDNACTGIPSVAA